MIVLGDKKATDKYGEKAKDGVIQIKTKRNQKVEIRSENGVEPVIVVDGVIKDIEINEIDPEIVESMTVLNAVNAIPKYGEKEEERTELLSLYSNKMCR